MPVGGEVLIVGEYVVTYNSVAIGILEGDAGLPTLSQMTKAEPIANTSKYGKSTLDAIYQGADWFAQFTCLEYKAGPLAAFWPFHATLGHMGIIGRLYFDLALPLVLTSIAGTPAATTPATLTATRAILAPGFNTQLLFGPTLRKVPIRLQLLPFDVGGAPSWFTQT